MALQLDSHEELFEPLPNSPPNSSSSGIGPEQDVLSRLNAIYRSVVRQQQASFFGSSIATAVVSTVYTVAAKAAVERRSTVAVEVENEEGLRLPKAA